MQQRLPMGGTPRQQPRCRPGATRALKVLCSLPGKQPAATQSRTEPPLAPSLTRQAGTLAANVALSMALLTSPLSPAPLLAPPPANAEIVRLPASSNPEVLSAQQTLVEAWSIIGETFVDPAFNGLDWGVELRSHMMAAYNSGDGKVANQQLDMMLAQLGDPYTRHIDPTEYQRFRVSADGELQGVGLLIANQLSDGGHLLVLAPIKGGPADRAGVLPGDEVVSIDGHQTKGLSGEQAAQLLRGRGGTTVQVKLARRTDQIPGVAGVPEGMVEPRTPISYKEVSMKRERVQLSPVFYTALENEATGEKDVGYVRLTQFSNNAADDMRAAINDLESQGMHEYILDLRSNPGGLVSAGIDIASLWLDGEQPVFNIQGREGEQLVQTTQQTLPALTHAPLVVLVDDASASASEILSGALRDNHRATIIGDSHTFGKGRIQTVYELQDGSALFVTVAKYQTPSGSEIDLKGINPDSPCQMQRPPPSSSMQLASAAPLASTAQALAPQGTSAGATSSSSPQQQQQQGSSPTGELLRTGSPAGSPAAEGGEVEEDSRLSPPAFSPGIPLGPIMERNLLAQLRADKCILAAEDALSGQVGTVYKAAAAPTVAIAN